MTKYINKSAVMTELNRLIAELVEEGEDTMFEQGRISAFEDVKVFINHTLEAKEVQEEPVSNDLEEAAREIGQKYFPNENNIWARPNYEAMAAANAFKEGAQWQKKQDQPTIELAEDHAYLAGQEKIINKACEWLENHNDYICGGTNGISWYDMQQLVKDFKKAMENKL